MKFDTASDYSPALAVEARRMCLHVATVLGDLLEDMVVVGGLVPYLIIDQATAAEAHVGTRDLDLGLSLAVLDDQRYREISVRLRDRGFEPGRTEQRNLTRQTWTLPGQRITIDFLIPRAEAGPSPGKLQNLEGDFAAIVTAAPRPRPSRHPTGARATAAGKGPTRTGGASTSSPTPTSGRSSTS